LRLHALQYLLIGLANCVFYLLLLALAEHIGFAPAYVASALASTALITSYSGAVLRSMRRAVPIGALYLTRDVDWFDVTFGRKTDERSRLELHA
jgi:inner membrane protein